ncbi:MAG: amidohydrolase [Erysipelotrichaceae bacterium]
MKIYYNADIYGTKADAFVVDGDKFIYVGEEKEALKYEGDYVDLNGKAVYPGFIDSHMHLVNYGKFLANVSLYEHTSSLKEMLDELKKYTDRNMIIARGWNHDYFEDVKRFPTKADLDSVSSDIPIVITRACGHIAVANSKALELCPIKQSDSDVDIENGIFKENSVYPLYNCLPRCNKDDIKNYILKAQKKVNSYGITSVHSDDFLSANDDYHDALKALEELRDEGKLTVRIYEQSQFLKIEDLKEFINKGYHTGVGNEYFKIGPLKLISDGSLGARTALLSRDYNDAPGVRGLAVLKKEELYDFMEYGDSHNMQIAIHAIGDGILDVILDKYKDMDCKNKRHGVVHCQITRSDQLAKFSEFGLHAYIQSIFLDYDNHIVEDRVGKDLASTSYNFKYLFDKCKASNGSDCPVEMPDVLKGIQLSVTRTSIDSTGPYLKEQALTVNEAIDSFTVNGAYASFEESIKGAIESGYLADFVVVDQKIEKCDVNRIKDIKVLETYVGGKRVF